MTNQAVLRGQLTHSLGNAAHSGEHGFKVVPGLLKRVKEERAWEHRLIVETGEMFEGFHTFEEYVESYPPQGLGIDMETLKRLIANDNELFEWVLAEERKAHPHGGDRVSEKARQAQEQSKVNNINLAHKKPQGTSKAYALQKLSDEGEIELLERVNGGKISANEAMKKAGFRRPRVAIALDDPQSAAKTILDHASPEFVEELRRLLG